jgi:serine/threonine protein kinase
MDPFPDRGISYSKLITATNSFNNRLGQGATGEVFQGILDEVPIAVKRLRLDDLEKEDVVIALERRFQAEITVLQKYAHARIVRILGFAINEKLPSPYPFAIVLELLKGGSLSDWLRGPNGEPPRRSHHAGNSLSAVERVDIALGAASGLAYLHGLRDVGDRIRIGEIDECVLHRDIKSANIGLAIHADGTLYAKLLDCGLAKALKGIDKGERSNAAAASGDDLLRNCVSFTGGLVCGTVGYMAPELSQGVYTVLSEVYAFGVVLLELLLGYRVGQRTAALIDEEADNGGIDAIVSRADVIWPLEASKFLTSLTLECISLRERRRPVAIAIILDRLKELRKIIEVAAPKQVLCTVCLDECIEETGVFCTGGVDVDNGGAPGIKHFVCCGCLQVHVITFAEDAAKMRGTGGKVPCVSSGAGGCTATWNITDIGEKLDKATHVVFSKALQHAAFDAPRHKLEQEAALAAAEAAAKEEGLRISEKVRRLRNVIVDRDLTLHCPRCGQAFYDFDGCNALRCKSACGAAFCGLCMVDCGDNAHPHYYSIHRGMNIFDRQAFENAKRDRSKSKLIAAVKAEKGDANVMMALIEELGKADLVDLGLSIDDLKREVQVLEVLPNPLPDVPIELVSLLKKEIIRMNPDYLQKVVSKLWTLLYQKAETKLLCINAQAIEVLTCLAREPFVQNNVKSIEKICGALQCMATLDSGRRECVAQGTIQVLTALGRSTVVKNNASAVYTLVLTLGNIACIDSGLNICLAEKTEIVLTNLALEAAVRIDVQVAAAVVSALCPLAITKVGTLACLACRSLSAVMILLNDGSFQVYTEGVHKAAYFLSLVSHYDEGVVDCNAAGVVEILSSLSRKNVVRADVDTVRYVADALTNLASSEKGSSAWFACDTTATLTQLCRERIVKESEVALYAVMTALRTIAESERGRSECIRVGTVVTLCSLTHERVIKENELGIHSVYMILSRIVSCDDGRKACLDARVIDALTILIKTNTVKRNVGVAVELVNILDKLLEEIEGRLQCAQAGTVATLTNLSLEPAINRNEYALRLITTTIDNMSVLPDVLPTVPHIIVRIC